MGIFKREKAPPVAAVSVASARIAFFTDLKRPPVLDQVDWDFETPVEKVLVDLTFSRDADRPRADVFMVLSYILKIAYNLGPKKADRLLWPTMGHGTGMFSGGETFATVGPVGADLELVAPGDVTQAATRTFRVEVLEAARWYIQSPYEGIKGQEDYYAPMSVWALIRAVRSGLAAPERLDNAINTLWGLFVTMPDAVRRTTPESLAVVDEIVDAVLGAT